MGLDDPSAWQHLPARGDRELPVDPRGRGRGPGRLAPVVTARAPRARHRTVTSPPSDRNRPGARWRRSSARRRRWPRRTGSRGPLRARVALPTAHGRVASYLRGAEKDEPDPDPPADAAEPAASGDGLGGAGEADGGWY